MKLFACLLLSCLASGVFAAAAKPICGGTASTKEIQLLTPNTPPRECVYHIKAYSSSVCQLRVDFAMELAQPSLPTYENGLSKVVCDQDYFLANGLKFCGVETSQHIYVPLNRTAGITTLDLSFVLANRVGYTNLPKPWWNVKITQLECPSGSSIRSVTPESRASIKDGYFVAPPGCLQYFPDSVGTFTSFNYNNGRGIYTGGLNYAICFRRLTYTHALQVKALFFKLGAERSLANKLDLDNFCMPQLRTEGVSEDYIMIPQSFVEQKEMRATLFCGDSAQGWTIRSTNPGPLMMIFNSDGLYRQNETGYAFSYRLL